MAKSEDDLPPVREAPYPSSFKSHSGRDIIVVRDRQRLVDAEDDNDVVPSLEDSGEGDDQGEGRSSAGKLKLFDSIRVRKPRRKGSLSSFSSASMRSLSSSLPSPSSSSSSSAPCAATRIVIDDWAGRYVGDECGNGAFYYYANETLPYEVLLHIFGHLSMRELGVVCAVCKFWKEASEADCLWKSLTLSLWGGLGLHDIQRAAASNARPSSSPSSSSSAPSSPTLLRHQASSSSSPSSSPKPPRKRGLFALLGSGGHEPVVAVGESTGWSAGGKVAALPQQHGSQPQLPSHGGDAQAAAAAAVADYLGSFSTLKDLYRHEFERRQRHGEDEYRIVVVGASGVDKSAICVRFVQGSLMLTKYDPTAEESYRVRRRVDGLPCMYDIMDTAGQMEYSALRDQYLKSGHGFLLVYSVTSPESFQALEKLRLQILRIKEDSTVPIVFLGSHADRESQRQVSQDEALFLAEKLNCGWLECSAKTGQNVNDAFELIVRMINRWRALHPNWNRPKQQRQEATIKNRVKKKMLFWRDTSSGGSSSSKS